MRKKRKEKVFKFRSRLIRSLSTGISSGNPVAKTNESKIFLLSSFFFYPLTSMFLFPFFLEGKGGRKKGFFLKSSSICILNTLFSFIFLFLILQKWIKDSIHSVCLYPPSLSLHLFLFISFSSSLSLSLFLFLFISFSFSQAFQNFIVLFFFRKLSTLLLTFNIDRSIRLLISIQDRSNEGEERRSMLIYAEKSIKCWENITINFFQ